MEAKSGAGAAVPIVPSGRVTPTHSTAAMHAVAKERRQGTANPGGDSPLRALCRFTSTASRKARAAGTITRRASKVRRAARERIAAMISDSAGPHPWNQNPPAPL